MSYKKETIEKCARGFIATLTKEELTYCTDKERGEYMGFAALHDLMDANVELIEAITALGLPQPSRPQPHLNQCPISEEFSEEQIPFLNRVMDQVNIQLKGESE